MFAFTREDKNDNTKKKYSFNENSIIVSLHVFHMIVKMKQEHLLC